MEVDKGLDGRIKKGIALVKSAVSSGDVELLGKCLRHFIALSVPIEKVEEAIKECPVKLLEEAGFCLKINSVSLGRDIVLGKDVPWSEVSSLLARNITGETLKSVLETREIFEGKIVVKGGSNLFA